MTINQVFMWFAALVACCVFSGLCTFVVSTAKRWTEEEEAAQEARELSPESLEEARRFFGAKDSEGTK